MGTSERTPGKIFITGASSGIGLALADAMLARGWSVALAARREEPMRECAERHAPGNRRSMIVRLDVGEPGALDEALRSAHTEFEGLDVVVANAGIGIPSPVDELTPDNLRRVLEINVVAAAETLRLAIPLVSHSTRALLVGVSSLAAYRGGPGASAYNASKAAFSSYLESLRAEIAERDIRVLDVRPGFIRTPMTDRNRFSMPFLMDVEDAARVLAGAIERRRQHVAFPHRMAWLMACLRHMPDGLFDRLARRMAERLRRTGRFPQGPDTTSE